MHTEFWRETYVEKSTSDTKDIGRRHEGCLVDTAVRMGKVKLFLMLN
jgi:hypothetical protein